MMYIQTVGGLTLDPVAGLYIGEGDDEATLEGVGDFWATMQQGIATAGTLFQNNQAMKAHQAGMNWQGMATPFFNTGGGLNKPSTPNTPTSAAAKSGPAWLVPVGVAAAALVLLFAFRK